MNNYAVFLAAIAAVCTLGCGKKNEVVKRAGEPDVVGVSSDNALMERAIKKAKETRGDFIEALQHKRPTMKAFAIKKRFAYGNDNGEHIWLNEVSWDGNVFWAVVNNVPVHTKDVK